MSASDPTNAWTNDDGSTNVAGFLAAYAADDSTFWRAEIGHIQNVLDDRIYTLEEALTLLDLVTQPLSLAEAVDEERNKVECEQLLVVRAILATYRTPTTLHIAQSAIRATEED